MRCKCVLSIAVASSVSLLSQAEIIWLCSSTVYKGKQSLVVAGVIQRKVQFKV